MKALIGLGNPEKKYAGTRHNIGQALVERFVGRGAACRNEPDLFARTCTLDVEGIHVLAILPTVYMNESGKAARAVMQFYKINVRDLLVVHDDMDIEIGEIRFSKDASSGGNRGVQSIIDVLGTKEFARLRIGVSGPLRKQSDPAKYVLARPPRSEELILRDTMKRAVDALADFYTYGDIRFVMNRYNRKALKHHEEVK